MFTLALLTLLSASAAAGQHDFEAWRRQIRSALYAADRPLPLEASSHGRFEPEAGIVAERVTYATQHGLRVPAVLYRPVPVKGKLPALIVVNGHGGDKFSWYAMYSGVLTMFRSPS